MGFCTYWNNWDLTPFLRYELETGNLVGGRSHTQKAIDYSTAIQRWINTNPNASFADKSAAENILRDLQNSLQGKP